MSVDELLQPILNTTVSLKPSDNKETIPEWDSLAQINIVAAVEDLIGHELSTEEVLSLTSVENVLRVCKAHGLELEIGK